MKTNEVFVVLKIVTYPPDADCKLLFIGNIGALISHNTETEAMANTLVHFPEDLQGHDLQTLVLNVVGSVFICLLFHPADYNPCSEDARAG